MKCAIMQPTYLPWAGYFNLMASVDIFVFYDSVQFVKRSWIQRNRIIINKIPQWITIPVLTKGKFNQLINETKIDPEKNWKIKHIKALELAYSNHKYGTEILNLIKDKLGNNNEILSSINIDIIMAIAEKLNLKPEVYLSSRLPVSGKRSEYLINICNHLKVDEYLSPIGSKNYIDEDGLFENSNIKLEYQNFKVNEYPQKGFDSFVSHLSIIDVIANLGYEKTRDYILNV